MRLNKDTYTSGQRMCMIHYLGAIHVLIRLLERRKVSNNAQDYERL